MESTNKITVTVSGSSRVDLVENLRAFADNLDGTPAAPTGKVAKSPAAKKPTAAKAAVPVDEDDDFAPQTDEASGFDDDTTETVEASSDDAGEDFTEEPPPKKTATKGTKAAAKKKITLDDVNDACKAHAAAKGRPATLQVLQKKFKTQSVTALKPEQYEACIAAMAVN